MTKKLDIICVAQPSWSGNYAKSTVMLMKEMASIHNVLYVDYAYTFSDVIQSLFKRKQIPLLRILGIKKRLTREANNLHWLSLPPVIPVNFLNEGFLFRWLTKINAWWISLYINRSSKNLEFHNPIIVNAFAPLLGKTLQGKLNESLTVYYNYDDIGTAAWASKHGKRSENQFAPLADLVIVSSDQLRNDRLQLNPKTFTIKNAVSDDWFKYRNKNIGYKSKPIAGFVGSLDDRIDYDLLYRVANTMPQIDFHFVGRKLSKEFDALCNLNNVTWIAPVAYDVLPELIQQFDIGLIPFIKSTFTANIYPLKINEYLALGKPVVMTTFANLPEFDDVVYSADDHENFVHAIQDGINSNSISRSLFYKSIAAKNTWNKRAQEFASLIQNHLINIQHV